MWWYLLEVRNMGKSEALEVQGLQGSHFSDKGDLGEKRNEQVVVAEPTLQRTLGVLRALGRKGSEWSRFL